MKDPRGHEERHIDTGNGYPGGREAPSAGGKHTPEGLPLGITIPQLEKPSSGSGGGMKSGGDSGRRSDY